MATRAKKGTEATFFDTFGEWSAEDQAAALKTLQIQHEQTLRMEKRLVKAKPQALKPHGSHLIGADGVCVRCQVGAPQ